MVNSAQVPSPGRPGTRGGKPTLDLRRITVAAIELLDEVGLAELTTRRLAAKLGVQSATLYWHVRNKAELLDLVAEAICADAFVIDSSEPWRVQLECGLRQFRCLVLLHRDAAALLRSRPATGPHRLGHIETTMRILAEAGFSDRESAVIARMLTAHVLASVPDDHAPGSAAHLPPPDLLADKPNLQRILPLLGDISEQERFELGAEIILDGLERRANRSR